MNCELCTHTSDKKYHVNNISEEKLPESVTKKIDENTIPHANALGQRIWKTKTIYWRCVIPDDMKIMSKSDITDVIKKAFLEASMQTPLVIRQTNSSDAHIVINWLSKEKEPYFTSNSILAFGYGPGSGIGGNITMNKDVLWRLDKTPLTAKQAFDLGYISNYDKNHPDNIIRTYDPLHTLKHEGGHALGMNHITDPSQKLTAVMYPYYNGLREFGKADIDYLNSLYGKASLSDNMKYNVSKKYK